MRKLTKAFGFLLPGLLATGIPLAAQETGESSEAAGSVDDTGASLGGLSIKPSRIELQAGSAGATVTLANVSDAPISYRIDLTELGIDEMGNFRALAEGEEATWSAAAHVQYSPRQVTLAPGERQRVRIVSRAPRDTQTGEYRSHMSFTSIPLVEEQPAAAKAENADPSFSIGVQYRVSIPLLLRVGELTGGTRIESARIATDEDGRQSVLLAIGLTGTSSDWVGARILDAQGEELGRVTGVSVMAPSRSRTFSVPIADTSRPAKIELLKQKTDRSFGELIETFVIP